VDITLLGITIDHALYPLKRYFCKPNSFTEGSVHITKFLKDSKDGFLENIDKEGTIHRNNLSYIPIHDDKMARPMETCIDVSLESCIQLT
jgi:hypothetical protein